MNWVEALVEMGRSSIAFLLIISVLVSVHELGHFLFARLFKMRVNVFAVFACGYRGTNLKAMLERPLAPAWIPWTVGLASTALLLVGSLSRQVGVAEAGLVGAGLVIPMWVAFRLAALYHQASDVALKNVGYGIVGALGVLALTGKISEFQLIQSLAAVSAGAWIGMLWLYYLPARQKIDEDRIGSGSLVIDGETVPVEFKPLLGRTGKDGVLYALYLLPIGGFVNIHGMHPREDGSETKIEGGFYSKPAWQRAIVLLAGPVFSIVLGIALLFGAEMMTGKIDHISTKLELVAPEMPAAKAGLKAGDVITEIDRVKVTKFSQVRSAVQLRFRESDLTGIPIQVTYLRDGVTKTVTITPTVSNRAMPRFDENDKVISEGPVAQLGVMGTAVFGPAEPSEAMKNAMTAPAMALDGLGKTFRSVNAAKENVGGAISIAQTTGEVSRRGLGPSLYLAGALSISLGILNLLPIVPLDGGQIVIAVIEMLRGGKRPSYQFQSMVSGIGSLLVLLLMVTALVLDLGKLAGKKPDPAKPPSTSKPAEP